MQIKELHVYGYGKLHQRTFLKLGKHHVFFGENEAGKSTIMSFIHSILFGFPLKTKNENRYEPKEHSSYGGKLIIETEEHGKVTIQRLKGKAAGDVTVIYSDGRVGNEADLNKILQGIDKYTYQSIFSFDLNGLSELQKLQENEVSRYLLSSGLLGSDGLLQTEQELQKGMDSLFKPSGRNPKINRLLNDLKTTYGNMQEAGKEQDQYETLHNEYQQCVQKKKYAENEVARLEKNISSSYNYQTAAPLLLEKKKVENRLEEMGDFLFPLDGEEKYQLYKQALLPLETSVTSIEKQIDTLKEKADPIQISEGLLENKESILKAIENAALLESMKKEEYQLRQNIQQMDSEIQRLKDYSYINYSNESILKLDTSSMKKDFILQLDKRNQKLQHDKQHLEEKQENERSSLQALDQKIAMLSKSLLPAEQRELLNNQVEKQYTHKQNEYEYKHIQETIASLELKIKAVTQKEKRDIQNTKRIFMSLIILFSIGALVSLFLAEWIFMTFCFSGIAVSLIIKQISKQSSLIPEMESELLDWQREMEQFSKNENSNLSDIEYEHAKNLIEHDNANRQQLQYEQLKKTEYEESFSKIVDRFEQWEKDSIEIDENVKALLKEWGLQLQHRSTTILISIYESLVSIKQHIYEKEKLEAKLQLVLGEKQTVENAILNYCEEYASFKTNVLQEAILVLKKKLSEVERKNMEKKQYNESIQILSNQLAEASYKITHLNKQLQELYNEANCKEEESFIQYIQLSKEKKELEEKRDTLRIQLKPYSKEIEYWLSEEQIINEYTIRLLEEQRLEQNQMINNLNQQLADLKYKIKQLEEGGTFDEQSFRFFTEKAALNVEAKEWIKHALAKHMLTKVVSDYKNTKLPAILAQANDYIETITDREYVRLEWSDEDGSLHLQRKDGIVFKAEEVSRGTQEAVYVALRLSLAKQSFVKDPMPIIIDDSFVNFDEKRVERVIAILQSIQSTHQVIFFTCHKYLVDYFNQENVTILNN